MSVFYEKAVKSTYKFEVRIDGNDFTKEARADAWLHSHGFDYKIYYTDHGDICVYCFENPKWATLFKLTWG